MFYLQIQKTVERKPTTCNSFNSEEAFQHEKQPNDLNVSFFMTFVIKKQTHQWHGHAQFYGLLY